MALPVRLFDFRRLLNSVSFPFLIKWLFELHINHDRRRAVFFLVVVIFALNCFRQNMLAFYYMSRGEFEQYKQINRYAHAFYEVAIGSNSILILAGMSYISFSLPMIHYTLFRCFHHFEREWAELVSFAGSILEQRFTFIDRLFKRLPIENHRKLIGNMLQKLRQFDRLRFIVLFGRLEKVWLVLMGGILALMAFIGFYSAEIIYTATGSEITGEFVLVIAAIVSYLIPIALGCAFPVLLLCCLFLVLFSNQAFWKHFCADFRSLHLRSPSTFGSIAIYKKIHYGYRVWIETFAGISKINRYMVCEIFAMSVGLTLMADTILLVELLIVPSDWRIQFVQSATLTLQFLFGFSLTIILLRLRQRLYCLSPLIRHHLFRQSISGQLNFTRLRSLWKGHFNIEILCPNRKWAFNLGPLGKITSHNILLKCPAFYTALILFILPVVERENIRK